MPPEIKPRTPLALAIHTRMQEVPLSAKGLALEAGVVYETIRGIVKGDRPPSISLLRSICRILSLDVVEMQDLLTTDQVNRNYGRLPTALTRANSELRPIEEAWPLLQPEQKEHVLLLVEKYSQQKKGRQAATLPRLLPRPVRKP
ncbi:MAG: helix-turn-helix transcriptional regulator [Candidatus Sulfotelmatobacter sp.]